MDDIIFPIDCSKENIRYLLDIGCRVVVTIAYKRFWQFETHINTCELRYSSLEVADGLNTEILDMSPVTPEYFWNNDQFALYINRNDLL